MSYSTLKKKLQPANKAFKTLTKTVGSKLHSFSFSKTLNVIKSNSHRLLSYCSLHICPFFKKRTPYLRRRRHHRRHLYQCYYTNNRNNKDRYYRNLNFSPIYLDQFFSVQAAGSATVQAKNSHSGPESSSSCSKRKSVRRDKTEADEKDLAREEGSKGKEKILYSIEDAWREVVAKSPQLRPVDDRAEEFISNFRKEMRLQKEKSIVEFEEMLARGT